MLYLGVIRELKLALDLESTPVNILMSWYSYPSLANRRVPEAKAETPQLLYIRTTEYEQKGILSREKQK
jgi:hypothetical protein